MTTISPINAAAAPAATGMGQISGIPVRNLWLLMLYASRLYRHVHQGKLSVEDNPEDIPDLVAEILARMVEKRLKRNLTFAYQAKVAVLSRVRGRIDLLETERSQLLLHGKVACRFDNLTVDTVRNRYVRAALDAAARLVTKRDLAHRCRVLSTCFERAGVSRIVPTRAEVSTTRYGRHDGDDQLMVEAAKLIFELALPTELAGNKAMALPSRDVNWIRRLYEAAVGGFYDVTLSPQGWRICTGQPLHWLISEKTAGIDNFLPSMRTDIVLNHNQSGRRIVIDTKFTSILLAGRFGQATFRSEYLYQMYAYLRSQVGNGDSMADTASGLLMHPAVGEMIDEVVTIQAHPIRFITIDLAGSASRIRQQLLNVVA